MDFTDEENEYEKILELYKKAELTVEENDVEITYLQAKLEELNKNSFQINKAIKHYETKFEKATLQSIEIDWKQKKANTVLSTIKQYEAQLQQSKFEKEDTLERPDPELENLKKQIELLEKNCSENTEIIIKINEELVRITDECVILKYEI